MLTFTVVTGVIMVLAGSVTQAADQATPGRQYIYKHTRGEPQAMEVYFPEGHDPAGEKVPCLLLFHGGGWGNGDLSTFRYDCSYFASRGIVAATANYFMHSREDRQKLPETISRKQACVTDAKSAIRWIKQHAAELGIDPEKIVVGGGSAGGHISLLATLNPGINDPADPVGIDTSVAGYVLFNPALSDQDEPYPDVNALNFLSSGFKPAVVFFGSGDKWKPAWDKAHELLNRNGDGEQVQLWLAEGQEHGFFNRQPWKDLTMIKTDIFLESIGILSGEPTLKTPPGDAALTR